MNKPARVEIRGSACPHDCPSTCSLDVEVIEGRSIGRVRGSRANDYTAGVICAKVARYAERIHHPDRLTKALLRTGPKGSGQFREISVGEALDRTAEAFLDAERRLGAAAVWPYYFAGTMGLVMRDGINRLRHVKKYSRQYSTICTNPAWTGFIAGTGRLAGPDPREMAKADLVVIWGTNPVNTQVNVMTHAARARKERGAKIAVVDVYRTGSMEQADIPLLVKPGTDAALACAVMHVLFRDGYADRAYMAEYADRPADFERHLKTKTPEWAAAITGLPAAEIEAFARAVGTTPRTFLRLGYGFARQRNGTVAMHAAASIATVAGLWKHEGGGAFHNNGAIYRWRKALIEGLDVIDPRVRQLDQSRIGPILTGEDAVAADGPPVAAMLIQNTNPVSVAPEQDKVKRGFAREDLFVATHEQFMTETALMSDIVLPATMFLEHDDIYQGGGHQYLQFGPKLIDPPGACLSNHAVICGLAERVGAEHEGFRMSARAMVDRTLQMSGRGTLAELEAAGGMLDVQPDFRTAHYLDGFAYRDGKYRFAPDWTRIPNANAGPMGPHAAMPEFPDQWDAIEAADAEHPFRLATSPARSFLNSTFTETPSSLAREVRPEVMIHPEDAVAIGIADGQEVLLGNRRGEVRIRAKVADVARRGVLIAESIWPNRYFPDGRGINTLTGADAIAPYGGAAFHDNKVWIRPA